MAGTEQKVPGNVATSWSLKLNSLLLWWEVVDKKINKEKENEMIGTGYSVL